MLILLLQSSLLSSSPDNTIISGLFSVIVYDNHNIKCHSTCRIHEFAMCESSKKCCTYIHLLQLWSLECMSNRLEHHRFTSLKHVLYLSDSFAIVNSTSIIIQQTKVVLQILVSNVTL